MQKEVAGLYEQQYLYQFMPVHPVHKEYQYLCMKEKTQHGLENGHVTE